MIEFRQQVSLCLLPFNCLSGGRIVERNTSCCHPQHIPFLNRLLSGMNVSKTDKPNPSITRPAFIEACFLLGINHIPKHIQLFDIGLSDTDEHIISTGWRTRRSNTHVVCRNSWAKDVVHCTDIYHAEIELLPARSKKMKSGGVSISKKGSTVSTASSGRTLHDWMPRFASSFHHLLCCLNTVMSCSRYSARCSSHVFDANCGKSQSTTTTIVAFLLT